MKGEGEQEAAEEPKYTCEMTPAPGRSPGSQMAVGSVMVDSWPCWFFGDGEDSSDAFPQKKNLKETSCLSSHICYMLLVLLWEWLSLFMTICYHGSSGTWLLLHNVLYNLV